MRLSAPTGRRPVTALVGVAAAALLATAAAAGQAGSDTAEIASETASETAADIAAFDDRAAVTLIEVPVHVVGRDGRPVRGLGADDFELFDDGRRQVIAGLEVVDLAAFSPSRRELRRAAEQPPAVARRHVLLLFDLTFSRPASILKARTAARRFVLEHLHPTDLAAVATFTVERGPQLLVTFTPDRAQLARALETLGAPGLTRRGQEVDPLGLVIEAPRPGGLADGAGLTSGGDVESAVAQHLSVLSFQRDRARKAYERGRLGDWSRAMAEMARRLGAVDGRKHVVYFSEGFDGRLLLGRHAARDAEDAAADQRLRESGRLWLVDQDDTFGGGALQRDVAEMLEELRRADCILQAVDIGGLRTESGAGAGGDIDGSRDRDGDARDALFYLADATGGRLVEGSHDLAAELGQILDRHAVTYVLSYYPDRLDFDGAYHRLRVDLRAAADAPRGARLAHRAGYSAPRPWSELHPLEKALLASQAIAAPTPRRELDIALLAAPLRAAPGRAYVPLILEVDGPSLLLGHGGERLDIELYAYATDRRGEVRDFLTETLSFDLAGHPGSAERIRTAGVKFYGHLDLTAGEYLLRVLVRNAETGRTAVEGLDLRVPAFDAGELELLPPLVVEGRAADGSAGESGGRWLLVRESADPAAGPEGDVVYPFIGDGEPYVPAARPRWPADEDLRLWLVAYGAADGPVEVAARLADGGVPSVEGGSTDGTLEAVVREAADGVPGRRTLAVGLAAGERAAGDRTLEITLRDAAGRERTRSVALRVE